MTYIDIQELKQSIINENKIDLILEELNMHHIRDCGNYYSCGMPDGDNPSSTIIYKDNLYVDAHTRNIEDEYGISDIVSLVSFMNKSYITESVKWLCQVCGFDYYSQREEIPALTKWIIEMSKPSDNEDTDEVEHLTPINERVLNYFGKYSNILFKNDGITTDAMTEFELGYDLKTHRITIPIRDELGTLVGVKGRMFKEYVEIDDQKYIYLCPCAKSKILYGLDKTYGYIKKANEVIVFESEKSVMKAWSHGIKNTVAIGGHKLSKAQVQKLTHLGLNIVIAYDQGVELDGEGNIDKTFYNKEFDKFLPQQTLYCIYDKKGNILDKKESPIDNFEKWKVLYDKRIKVK